MSTDQPRKPNWIEQWVTPAVLLPFAAMLYSGVVSYNAFKDDTHDKVTSLEYRMKTLEAQVADARADTAENTKFRESVNTELALLKQRREAQ